MAGSLFMTRLADQFKLPELLKEQIRLKKRDRGCDDKDSLLGLIHNFCAGNGKLSDMGTLRADKPTVSLLGLEGVRSSKRMGEYLALFNANAVKALYFSTALKSKCQDVILRKPRSAQDRLKIGSRSAIVATSNTGDTIFSSAIYGSMVA